MLGSDFPNIPYSYAHQPSALVRFGFGRDWLRRVIWANGARLMQVPSPVTGQPPAGADRSGQI
ncbi:MAG TPA: hypothetical protein H9815_17260 [Candidatus Ruania gallistercoris]|uniref:Amidohydrolase-related domain-containing protein n=1 Tax=Candidatus Ruania gallistercoris TaxID=2838746 RepID=A0A9D2EGW4_9MICO|nr:hypothetical protein [Candidatus Ruania gallistercoris]